MIAEAARHSEWLAGFGGWDPHGKGHLIHPAVSLLVIVGLIGASVAASLLYPDRSRQEIAGPGHDGPGHERAGHDGPGQGSATG